MKNNSGVPNMNYMPFFSIALIAITARGMQEELIVLNENKPLLQKNSSSPSKYDFEKTLKAKGQSAKKVVFDPNDSNVLYTGSNNGGLRVWDVKKSKSTQFPKQFDSQKSGNIVISSDGKTVATYGYGKTITLFDCDTRSFTRQLTIQNNTYAVDHSANYISSIAFNHKDSNILAAGLGGDYTIEGQAKNTINIFNTKNGDRNILTGNMPRLLCIAMNPYNENELIVTSDHKVAFWDINTKKCTRVVNNEHYDDYSVCDIAFHPNQEIFITSTIEIPFKFCSEYINVWDIRERNIVRNIHTKGFGRYGVRHLAMHPNGKDIIASAYRLTQIIDFSTGGIIETLPNESYPCGGCFCSSSVNSPKHNAEIKQVALSNGGEYLATVAGSIKIWNCN